MLIHGRVKRRDIKRIILITLASLIFGVIYSIILAEGVAFGLVNGLLNGLFIGILDTLWVRKRRGRRLRQLPMISYTLVLTLIWVLIILFNMTLTRHWLGMSHDWSLKWMVTEAFSRHFLFCLFMAFTFNLILRVTSFLGARSLLEILLGRYQEPAMQQVAFLFLDVKGSTRLTESIGDTKTQVLIGNLFFDIAGLVDQHGGEVHRYIGDEMVVTWDLSKRRKMPDILSCLVEIYDCIDLHHQHNQDQYGAWVDLRAGLNAGPVLVSEIGDLKRELVYFGDTINTAAALQAYCKQAQVSILISSPLYRSLDHHPRLISNRLGALTIKGKIEQVDTTALAFKHAPELQPSACHQPQGNHS